MKKYLIVYWPTLGSVERAAQLIYNQFDPTEIDMINLGDFELKHFAQYKNLIIGASTVGAEIWQEAKATNLWGPFFADLSKSGNDLKGKKFATFGLGNQIIYPDHYVDGMSVVKEEFEKTGASIVGSWPSDDYYHSDSESDIDGYFVGLALDEDNEPELTEERAKQWVEQIKKEFEA